MTKDEFELKKATVAEFLSDSQSFRKVFISEDNNLYVNLRGIPFTDMLIDKELFSTLFEDLQNTEMSGKTIIDNMYKNISDKTFTIINRCIVDEEDQVLYTVEILKEMPMEVINLMILNIIEMTVPTKKKIQAFRIAMKRVDNKAINLKEMIDLFKMKR